MFSIVAVVMDTSCAVMIRNRCIYSVGIVLIVELMSELCFCRDFRCSIGFFIFYISYFCTHSISITTKSKCILCPSVTETITVPEATRKIKKLSVFPVLHNR